jgi:hypothetical protein
MAPARESSSGGHSLALFMQSSVPMLTTANPFTQVPATATLSAKPSRRERFRTTVFIVLAAHVVLLMVLLMGCNTQPSAQSIAETYPSVEKSR